MARGARGEARIIVCAGPGGVGKTTVSAAIALQGALDGKRSIVVTIDPARRLASSLGMSELGNTPTRIDAARMRRAGLKPKAPLWAMMLDTKRTFDGLVHQYAPTKAQAERILQNRFYQTISGALSGTHEYMAMEKLYELAEDSKYDLIVIDTPPTRRALDFLEAPRRLTSFLEARAFRILLLPALSAGKGYLRALNLATVAALKVIRRIVGGQVLEDTAEFLANFEGMYEGFKQRAEKVLTLLKSDQTSFLVITSADPDAVQEALFFSRSLNESGLPLGGLIINRVHPRVQPPSAWTAAATEQHPIVSKLAQIAGWFEAVNEREDAGLARLHREAGVKYRARVPIFIEEIVDLKALSSVAAYLAGHGGPEPDRLASNRSTAWPSGEARVKNGG